MNFICSIIDFFNMSYNVSMKMLAIFVRVVKNLCPMRSSGLRAENSGVSYSSDSVSQVHRTCFTPLQRTQDEDSIHS